MRELVGVVVGAKDDEVIFKVAEGALVERGQLLKIRSKEATFFARVNNVKLKTLLAEDQLSIAAEKVEKGEAPRVMEGGVRCFKLAKATLVAQLDEEGFPCKPSSVPSFFDPVERPTLEDLKALRVSDGDVEIVYGGDTNTRGQEPEDV